MALFVARDMNETRPELPAGCKRDVEETMCLTGGLDVADTLLDEQGDGAVRGHHADQRDPEVAAF